MPTARTAPPRAVAPLAAFALCAHACGGPPAPPADAALPTDALTPSDAPRPLAGMYAVDMAIGERCESAAPVARVALAIGEPVDGRVEIRWQLVQYDPSAGSPSVHGTPANQYGECISVLLADDAQRAGRDGTAAGVAPGQMACAIGNMYAQLQGGTARRTPDGVQVELRYLGTLDPVTLCARLATTPR